MNYGVTLKKPPRGAGISLQLYLTTALATAWLS
jgi:hypothetical protein